MIINIIEFNNIKNSNLIKLIKKNSVLSMLDQCIVSGSNFFMTFFLGRVLSVNDFGSYSIVNSLYYLLFGIQVALIITPMTLKIQNDDEMNNTINNNLIVSLFINITMIIIMSISLIYYQKEIKNILLLLPISLFLISNLLQEFFRRVRFSQLKIIDVLFYDVVYCTTKIISLIIVWFLFKNTLFNFYLVISITSLVVVIWNIKMNIRHINLQTSSIKETFISNWKYGKWLLGSQVFSWINTQLFLIVGSIIGSSIVAASINATQSILNLTNIFMIALGNIILAKGNIILKKYGIRKFNRYIWKMTIVMLSMMVLYTILLIINGDKILDLLYKGKYNDFTKMLMLWSISYILTALSRAAIIGVQILNLPRYNFYSFLLLAILSIIFVVPICKYSNEYGTVYWSIFSGVIISILSIGLYIYGVKMYKGEKNNEYSSCR